MGSCTLFRKILTQTFKYCEETLKTKINKININNSNNINDNTSYFEPTKQIEINV